MLLFNRFLLVLCLLMTSASVSFSQAEPESEISMVIEKFNKEKEKLNSLLMDLDAQEKELIANKEERSPEEYQSEMDVIVDKKSIVTTELEVLLKKERDYKEKNGIE